MDDQVYQKLLETSWRRELTPEETARLRSILAAHPEAQADWQAEVGLTKILGHLPTPPLASNFTAQVMRAVEALPAPRPFSLAAWWEQWGRRLWPKTAWATAGLVVSLTAWQGYHQLARTHLARDLAKIPVAATVPSAEILLDFDAIQRLSGARRAPSMIQTVSDEDLLAALR